MTKPPKSPTRALQVAAQRPPTPKEAAVMAAAAQAQAGRPKRIVIKSEVTGPPDKLTASMGPVHSDAEGFVNQLLETFGTSCVQFATTMTQRLERVAREHGSKAPLPDDAFTAILAQMAAIAPRDEFEASLAEQIVANHLMALEMMGMARHTDTIEKMQAYTTASTKFTRSVAVLTDTLNRHRSGGKQQIVVQHVQVTGTAIVGDGAQTIVQQGGGVAGGSDHRPHEPFALANGSGAAMLCEDPFGRGVPIARSQGPEAVPAPRRQKPRRAAG